jgi:alpha-glucuronidase
MRYFLLIAAFTLHAETGADAWLRHAPLDEAAARAYRAALPSSITTFTSAPVAQSAQSELVRGIRGMLGRTLRVQSAALPAEPALLLGTLADLKPHLKLDADLPPDGYWLTTATAGGITHIVVTASNDRGVLYGAFALLRKISLGESIAKLNEKQSPYASVRWVNEWNNLDGTIERGYGGRSIFWDKVQAREDLSRVSEYGRLLASLGINACSINNVNANPRVLAPDFLPNIARVAEAFRPWGVRVAIAVDFGSPKTSVASTPSTRSNPKSPPGGKSASTPSTPRFRISPVSS